ncbi:MAG: hypothetical protein NXI04_07055 [Planctomycetaceae bacterium]|nr:hypothetical protein [Planctomycetaceae bacterium]
MNSHPSQSSPSFPVVVDYERLARFETVLNLRDMKSRSRLKFAAVSAAVVALASAVYWAF